MPVRSRRWPKASPARFASASARDEHWPLIFAALTSSVLRHRQRRTNMILAFLMILAAGIFRLVPHPMNFAPVAALALIGGMYFGRRYALWVPLAVLAVTDLVLNVQMGYPAIYTPRLIDYGVFSLFGLLGLWARNRQVSVKIVSGFATPFLFYLISN